MDTDTAWNAAAIAASLIIALALIGVGDLVGFLIFLSYLV